MRDYAGGGGSERDGDWRGNAVGPVSRDQGAADPAGGFDRDQDWRGNAVGPISREEGAPTRAGFDGNADWRSSAAPVTVEEDAAQRGGAGGFDAGDWRGGGGAGPTSRGEEIDGDPRSGNVVAAPTSRPAGGDWVRGEVQARPDGPVRGAAGAGAGGGFSGGDPRGRAEPTRAPERGAPSRAAPSGERDWGRREPVSRGDTGGARPAAGGRQRLQLKPRSQPAAN